MTIQISAEETILKDLENIYHLAIGKENFTAALRAKELLGREKGLFSSFSKKNKVSLKDLSEDDLNHLIKEIEMRMINR